ncbi:MAG: M14 family metallopeptidase [Nonlabens sp.]
MKIYIVCLAIVTLLVSCGEKDASEINTTTTAVEKVPVDLLTPFEKGNGNQTATYEEAIEFYEKLSSEFSTISMEEVGTTDAGEPLHLVTYAHSSVDWSVPNKEKIKILVNNGIHPGESDGIDATMVLMRDLASGTFKTPENLIFSAIVVYNVGGALNRNSTTRTNQNGPESYGFRGNARNYDLNRDFIKADTRNARAFYQIYHKIYPDIFIDNHVSNGADYQYTLTHLFTQHNKLGHAAGNYVHNSLQPQLEKRLMERDIPITPYVNVHDDAPEKGFSQFIDHPRYSTGYTALWNTLGMMVETHMLKPYSDRVKGTKAIMEEMIFIGTSNMAQIKQARINNFNSFAASSSYALNHEINYHVADTLDFMGYQARRDKSKLTGNPLLTYDRNAPFTKKTTYHAYTTGTDSITIPTHYIIPKGYHKVLELLRLNNIQMDLVPNDSTMLVERYRIKAYQTTSRPYEGHFPHRNVELEKETVELRFRESDVIIPTSQPGIRYLLETLEPMAQDSFFKWNFFDTILQQKEGFSSYVFENTARELMENDPALQKQFDSIKRKNKDFARSNRAQLDWLHKRSVNYEPAHLVYPIYRYNGGNQ